MTPKQDEVAEWMYLVFIGGVGLIVLVAFGKWALL